MKVVALIIVAIFVMSLVIGICLNENKEVKMKEPKYQGPVPKGYDEDYFRETGITKLKEINK